MFEGVRQSIFAKVHKKKYTSFETFAFAGVCGRPRTSLRVRLHGNSYLDGDKVTFSCNGNHDLFGKAELSCVGQTWDSTVPECKGTLNREYFMESAGVRYLRTRC